MRSLLYLWWLACRYRLDCIIRDIHPTWLLNIIFLPAFLFPKGEQGKNLRLFFESWGPVGIKFGQLLSTRPDIVPKALAQELNLLQDKVPPYSDQVFFQQLNSALGNATDQYFEKIDEQPLASASLAQVHRARLKPTQQDAPQDVVIKILRPGIKKVIQRDIRFMRWGAKWLARLSPEARRLKPIQVVEDYANVINQECDLRLEAANTQTVHDNFKGNPIHYTPRVYWDLVRANVLVTEYIDGIPVSDIEQMHQHNINIAKLAENGVLIFFKQVFEHNFFHADMHPGNIFVSKDYQDNPQYISIDCAIIGSLTDLELFQIGSLWLAVFERNYARAAEIMIASGWVRRSTQSAQLQAVIKALYEPIHDKPLNDIAFGYMLLDLFDQTRIFGLNLKPSQVLLQKTLINIEGLGKQLYPELDMFSIAKAFLNNWIKQQTQPNKLMEKWSFHGPMLLSQLHLLPSLLSQLDEQVD